MSLTPELAAWEKLGSYVELPGYNWRVFTRDLGDASASPAETLLLLHGYPESSYSYHKIVDGMARHFKRVVLFDMIGYGLSDKPGPEYSYSLIDQADIALIVWRQLNVTGGHVLSHDMGTSVLTELVARQVNGLLPVWLEPSFQSLTFTNGSMVLSMAKLRSMQKVLLSRAGRSVNQIASEKTFTKSVISAHGVSSPDVDSLTVDDIKQLWANCLPNAGDRKMYLTIKYLNDRRQFEKTRWLPALQRASKTTPVHLCWGDADQVARIEMARWLKQSICPQAVLTEMPGVGHFCQLGSPGKWLDAVTRFYQQ